MLTRELNSSEETVKVRRIGSEATLTPRERDVLEHLVRGGSNKAIAEQLGCAPRTVAFHVGNILRKTGRPTRGRLIASRSPAELEKNETTPRPVANIHVDVAFTNIRIDLLTHRTSIGGAVVHLSGRNLKVVTSNATGTCRTFYVELN